MIRFHGLCIFKSVFLTIFTGLTEPTKHKELLRRVHILHPKLLPPSLVASIIPSEGDMLGAYGQVSNASIWKADPDCSPEVTVYLHGSSDGVRPYKTMESSVRCIMGSLDAIYSPKMNLTVPIPDSPPFLIGVYKGKDKNSDVVLKPLVTEVLALCPPPRRPDSEVKFVSQKLGFKRFVCINFNNIVYKSSTYRSN